MPGHNILADPKPQAGSTYILRGEEGFKDLLQGLPVDSAAGVCHRDDDSAAIRLPICGFAAAEKQSSAPRLHCVYGIGQQIGKHLPDLALKTLDWFRRPVAFFHRYV